MKNVIQLRTKRSSAAPCTYHELMHKIAEEGGQVIEMFPSDKALAPDSLEVNMMGGPTAVEGKVTAGLPEQERQRRVVSEAVSALRFEDEEFPWPTYESGVHAFGIAERIAQLAWPLFELTADGEIVFLADPSIDCEVFEAVLAQEALPTVITYMTEVESYLAAGIHSDGSTLVGWPLSPPPGPTGISAGGRIIHAVRSEEDARELYMKALTDQVSSDHFFDDLRECLHDEIRA